MTPQLIAHRGAPRELRENTLPSFLRAVERGAQAVELDVHALADGTVVVHHDPVLGKDVVDPTLAGRPLAALRRADLPAVTFSDGTGIPTLADVLDALPAPVITYVEVKARGIEDAVAAVLRPHARRCAVHAFDHRIPAAVAARVPGLAAGILTTSYLVDTARVLRESGARDYWPHWGMIDAALVGTVHAAGGRVIAWTANDPDTIRQLAAWGVDGLCSDDLRMVRDALAH